MNRSLKDNDLVTVCASCLTASCWKGEFYCENYKTSGTAEKAVSELRNLNREHEDWFNPPDNLVAHAD